MPAFVPASALRRLRRRHRSNALLVNVRPEGGWNTRARPAKPQRHRRPIFRPPTPDGDARAVDRRAAVSVLVMEKPAGWTATLLRLPIIARWKSGSRAELPSRAI